MLKDDDLYQIPVTQFQTVVQLLWIRYAGFLVLQGFIANALVLGSRSGSAEQTAIARFLGSDYIVLVVALLGTFAAAIWHLLNYLGWLSQNYHLRIAANLQVVGEKREFFTDYFAGDLRPPHGPVYWIAQTPPVLLMAFYGVAFGYVLASLSTDVLGTALGFVLFFGLNVTLTCLEKKEFRRRCRDPKPS